MSHRQALLGALQAAGPVCRQSHLPDPLDPPGVSASPFPTGAASAAIPNPGGHREWGVLGRVFHATPSPDRCLWPRYSAEQMYGLVAAWGAIHALVQPVQHPPPQWAGAAGRARGRLPTPPGALSLPGLPGLLVDPGWQGRTGVLQVLLGWGASGCTEGAGDPNSSVRWGPGGQTVLGPSRPFPAGSPARGRTPGPPARRTGTPARAVDSDPGPALLRHPDVRAVTKAPGIDRARGAAHGGGRRRSRLPRGCRGGRPLAARRCGLFFPAAPAAVT